LLDAAGHAICMDARKILNLPASPSVNRSVLEDCKKNVINEKEEQIPGVMNTPTMN